MSSLPPRPKPWETRQGEASSSTPTHAPPATPSTFDTAVASSSSTAPQLPERPSELSASTSLTGPYASGAAGGGYGSRYGGYGGVGGIGGMGYGGYSSMNRLGGYAGGMGSYGSYGSYGMGGYGGGYGVGMPGYGVGGMAAPGEMNPSLTSSVQASTAPAFAVLESLVMAFTSMAQLIESTYMATHSSFFAMIGVADQLGSLKTYLGQVLGVFSILRLGRKLVAWLRGRKVQTDGWVREWAGAAPGSLLPPPGSSPDNSPRPSVKPLVLFLMSAVGLPYLMTRLVKLLIAQQQQQQQQIVNGMDGNLDPSKLTFARAKFEFRANDEWELQLARDEIVAVLEMREPVRSGDAAGWWRGRTRDGRIGWFPGNYVEVIRKREG